MIRRPPTLLVPTRGEIEAAWQAARGNKSEKNASMKKKGNKVLERIGLEKSAMSLDDTTMSLQ